jgi:YegS/Rv2252/BmrU family lipid kinase
MKHVFVFNPKSFLDKGKMDFIIDTIGQHFRKQEHPHFSIQISHFPRDAIGCVRREVKSAEEDETVRVYAIGGDGILFDCLNAIMDLPNTQLASIPYGNSSDFVRSFGEGLEEQFKDISKITDGDVIPTDVIAAGFNYALNSCTIGLEAVAVVKANIVTRRYKNIFNRFPFLYVPLMTLCGMSGVFDSDLLNQEYEIIIDGVDFSGCYASINVANGPCYGGNKTPSPTARPDDGFLNVILFKSVGAILTLMRLNDFLHGKTPAECKIIRAQQIEVKSKEALQIQLDGEVFSDTSLTIQVKPAAVQIVTLKGLTYDRPVVKRGERLKNGKSRCK